MRYTLQPLGFPSREVQQYADVVRSEGYDADINSDEELRALDRMRRAARSDPS